MKTYKVTVFLEVNGDEDDEDDFKNSVREAMQTVIDSDDRDDLLNFNAEEVDEEEM